MPRLTRQFVLLPEVLVPHFMRSGCLQLFRREYLQRFFRDQQNRPRMQSNECMADADHLDFRGRAPFVIPENRRQGSELGLHLS